MSQQFWFNFIFVWIGIMAILSTDRSHAWLERDGDKLILRWKKSWALLAFWPIFFTVVFTVARFDVRLYLYSYSKLPTTWAGLIQNFNIHGSGNLFAEIEILIRILFGTKPLWFRLIFALMQSIPLILIFRRYSENFLFTLFVFCALNTPQAWMMNGLRQFLAACIIFAATPLMLERKYFKAVLVVLIASRIHTSAFVMLPLIFVCPGQAWNRRTLLFLGGSVAAMAVFATFTGSFDAVLSGTEYAGTGAAMAAYGDDGMNPVRALVYAVPTVIAFAGRNRIMAANDPVINLCVNMSVATLGISLVAVVTSGIMVGRLPIYTNLYNFVLLPYLLKHAVAPRNVRAATRLSILLYLIFYLFETGAFIL